MSRHVTNLTVDVNNGAVCAIILFSSLIVAGFYYTLSHLTEGWLLYGATILVVVLLGYILVKLLSIIPISLALAALSGAWVHVTGLRIFSLREWHVIAIVALAAFILGLILGRSNQYYHSKTTYRRSSYGENLGAFETGLNMGGIPTFGVGQLAGAILDDIDSSKVTQSFDFRSWPLRDLIIPSLIGALVGIFIGLFNPGNLALRYSLVSLGSAIGGAAGTAIQASNYGGPPMIGTFATFTRGIVLGAVVTVFVGVWQGYWI